MTKEEERMENQVRKELEKMLSLISDIERTSNPSLKRYTQQLQIEVLRMKAERKLKPVPKLEVSHGC